MKDVSFVIPARNSAATIAACLESVAAQKPAGRIAEILVIENGSTDSTLKKASSFPVSVVQLDGTGRSAARNEGIRRAKGSWIAFVDADTELGPGWLSTVLDAAERSGLDALQGRVRLSGQKPGSRAAQRSAAGLGKNALLLASGTALPTIDTCAVLVRKSALFRVELFDEDLRDYEDTDLTWKLLAAGCSLGLTEKAAAQKNCSGSFAHELRRRFERGAAHARLLSKWDFIFSAAGAALPHDPEWRFRSKGEAPAGSSLHNAENLLLRLLFRFGDAVEVRQSAAVSAEKKRTAAEKLLSCRPTGRRTALRQGQETCFPFAVFLQDERLSIIDFFGLRIWAFEGPHRDMLELGLLGGLDCERIVAQMIKLYDAGAAELAADCASLADYLVRQEILRAAPENSR